MIVRSAQQIGHEFGAARTSQRVAVVLLCLAAVLPCLAQEIRPRAEELENVRVDQKLGETIPLELEFIDDAGRAVSLSEYFEADRPVILNLVYFECPMLCNLTLNALVGNLQEIAYTPGDEFEIVTVSINPDETFDLASKKKKHYLDEYGKSGADSGWHFLTGEESNIKALADAVGFRYTYVEDRDEYAHSSVQIIISPDGLITRYLPGLDHQPDVMRLSLIEASNGSVGSLSDRIFLSCFYYDESIGKYTATAFGMMRLFATITVVILAFVLLILWRRDSARRRALAGAELAR